MSLILVKRICSKVENINPLKNVGMKEGDGKVSRSSFTLNWQDKTDVLMYIAYGICRLIGRWIRFPDLLLAS